MRPSKYSKTIGEAYAEMYITEDNLEEMPQWLKNLGKAYTDTGKEAIRQTGNLIDYVTKGQGSAGQSSLAKDGTPKGPLDAYSKTGQEAIRQVKNLTDYVTKGEGSPSAAGGKTPSGSKDKGKTDREKVGLTDDPKRSAERAASTQADTAKKQETNNQQRKDNVKAGKVNSTLPSDYKKTELEAGKKAEASRAGAGLPQSGGGNQTHVETGKGGSSGGGRGKKDYGSRDANFRAWAKSNPKLAKNVKPHQSGYASIQKEINKGNATKPDNTAASAVKDMGQSAATAKPQTQKAFNSPQISSTPKVNTPKMSVKAKAPTAPRPQPTAATNRLDAATSNVGKWSESFDTWYEQQYTTGNYTGSNTTPKKESDYVKNRFFGRANIGSSGFGGSKPKPKPQPRPQPRRQQSYSAPAPSRGIGPEDFGAGSDRIRELNRRSGGRTTPAHFGIGSR